MAVGNWAERNNVSYGSYQELAGHPQVYEILAGHVAEVNRQLAEEPMMAKAQVHRFLILHKELDADDGELTRTPEGAPRLHRGSLRPVVKALYDGSKEADISTEVTFEDGRKGVISARVKVMDAVSFRLRPAAGRRVSGARMVQNPTLSPGDTMLKVENVSLRFGGVKANHRCLVRYQEGRDPRDHRPNGAGKTSMLNVINGFYHPQDGTITYKGATRAKMKPYVAASQGIARTFQNVALFKGMSTLDNIMVGRTLKMKSSFFWQIFRHGPAMTEEIAHRGWSRRSSTSWRSSTSARCPWASCPMACRSASNWAVRSRWSRNCCCSMKPMAGMNLEEKEDMCRFILDVKEQYGTTIALIEHDMGVVMDLSDRVVVLEYGRKIADGTPDEVKANQAVIDAYLGVAH